MNKIESWKMINRDLHEVCEKISASLFTRVTGDVFTQISYAFMQKATRTLRAVNLLYDNALNEQAQSHVRILFEIRVNYDCFLKMAQEDIETACMKVIDSSWFEKMKQMRSSNFAGLTPQYQQMFEKMESEAISRYDPDEIKRLRRFGFSGMSMEQCSRFTGHENSYNVIYRNFSRNVHSTDYMEHTLYILDDKQDEYIKMRDGVSLHTANFAAGGIAEAIDSTFKCGFENEINKIASQVQEIKNL